MTNIFMKVSKDLFNLGLNPNQILILAQVMEFNTNTGDCFISDKQLAEQFGISESTVKREIKKLDEELGFLIRETKNVKGGKERHMKVNYKKIEEKLTSVKLTLDNEDKKDLQVSNCPLTSVNLPFDKGQNDTIKDNRKDNLKDNIGKIEEPTAPSIFLQTEKETEKPRVEVKEEVKPDGTVAHPYPVDREWLIERHNSLFALKNGVFQYGTKFYKLKEG